MAHDVYEKVFRLAKRRGFLYPSFEIYGGSAGFYDYGPLGAALKANVESLWRELYVTREGCAEINCPSITPEAVFVASGHVSEFTDPMVRCTQCEEPYRADHLIEESGHKDSFDVTDTDAIDALVASLKLKCANCGGGFGKTYHQNLMFETEIGPGSKRRGFLRPETAQGIFMDYGHLYRYFREKLPFGVVQLGNGFRNEISPRQGMIRLREFNMMEAEIFVDPADGKSHPLFDDMAPVELTLVPNTTEDATVKSIGDAVAEGIVVNRALGYYMGLTYEFLTKAGLRAEKIRFRQHLETEMAHYANDCWDAEFHSERFGWIECVGIADRSAYDLSAHEKHSGHDLRALRRFDEPKEVTKTVVFPITKVLGPLFKGDAKKVAEALGSLDANTLEPASDAGLKVTIDDKDVQVPADAFEIRTITEKQAGDSFVPHVIEPSYGLDRILYALLEHAYQEEEASDDESGTVETYRRMRIPSRVAPIKVGVFPLVSKEGLPERAATIDQTLRMAGIPTQYDESGTVGRRYARQDEVGTPFCVTVDFDTINEGPQKDTVTVRERDTREQTRIAVADLVGWLRERI